MKVAFVGIGSSERSRTGVYRMGLPQEIEQASVDITPQVRGPSSSGLRDLGRSLREADVVVVATGSQLAVPLVKTVSRAPILLDAGWPLLDGVTSRRKFGPLGLQLGKTYAIDFASASLSTFILVESSSQLIHFARRFPFTRPKLRVLPTGVDEAPLGAPVDPARVGASDRLRVLWRGSYNPESGMERLWEAMRYLGTSDFAFTVWCHNLPDHLAECVPPGVVVDTRFHTLQEIGDVMRAHDLVLGQLSDHSRLDRTIPHKAFEAAFLGLPYLSTRAAGIEEMLADSRGALWVQGGSTRALVNALNLAAGLRTSLGDRGQDNRERYLEFAAQSRLSEYFADLLKEAAA